MRSPISGMRRSRYRRTGSGQHLPGFLDGRAVPNPEHWLGERTDVALGHIGALGLPDEGRRTDDAEAAGLVLEGVRHVILAQDQALGDIWPQAAEVAGETRTDRLPGLTSARARRGTRADERAGAAIDRDEDRGTSLLGGDRLGHVRAPDLVDPTSDDSTNMRVDIPDRTEIDLYWAEVALLPPKWRAARWRGMYLIFDIRDGKSLVVSAKLSRSGPARFGRTLPIAGQRSIPLSACA